MRKNATQIRDFNKNVLIHNFKTISCLVSLFHLLRFPYDQSDPDLIQQLVAIGIWGDGQNKIMVKLMLTLWRRVFKCSLQIRLYFVPTQTLLFTNVMDSSASSARSLLFLDKTDMVLLREYPYPGLLNEPPLDSLDLQSPNSPLASLWIGSGRQTWKSYFHYTISNSCCCHTATTIHQCLACIPLPQQLHNISIFTKCLMKTPKKLLDILQSKHQKTHTVSWIPITD